MELLGFQAVLPMLITIKSPLSGSKLIMMCYCEKSEGKNIHPGLVWAVVLSNEEILHSYRRASSLSSEVGFCKGENTG